MKTKKGKKVKKANFICVVYTCMYFHIKYIVGKVSHGHYVSMSMSTTSVLIFIYIIVFVVNFYFCFCLLFYYFRFFLFLAINVYEV